MLDQVSIIKAGKFINRSDIERIVESMTQDRNSDIYVDFTETLFITSSAVGLLLSKKKNFLGRRIWLVTATSNISHLLDYVGVTIFYKVVDINSNEVPADVRKLITEGA